MVDLLFLESFSTASYSKHNTSSDGPGSSFNDDDDDDEEEEEEEGSMRV